MNTLDIILLVLLLIAAVAGWRKGIIVQACGIAGLVLGILFAMRFSRTIGGWLGAGEELSPVLGFVVILVVSILVLALIGYLFKKVFRLTGFGIIDRLGGLALSVVKIGMLLAVLTGFYVIFGGYMATAINDFIQGIIMLGGIVAVILAVLNGQGGFIQAIKTMAEIPSDVPVTMGQPGAFTSFFGPDPLNLLGVVILTSLGTWGLPQMVGKFYAIKDEKSINTGTVISTLFAIVISGGCYFLGGFGRLFDAPELHDEAGNMIFDGIIPHMLSTLPDILIGIVVVLVLSASM